jgi:hypothetical protein
MQARFTLWLQPYKVLHSQYIKELTLDSPVLGYALGQTFKGIDEEHACALATMHNFRYCGCSGWVYRVGFFFFRATASSESVFFVIS